MNAFWWGLLGGIVGATAMVPLVALVTCWWIIETLDKRRREVLGFRGTRADALELL